MAVSTTVMPEAGFTCPIVQLIGPSFLAGRLALNHRTVLSPEEIPDQTHGAFNLGQVAGLHGLASLIPLFAVWSVAAIVWMGMEKRGIARSLYIFASRIG